MYFLCSYWACPGLPWPAPACLGLPRPAPARPDLSWPAPFRMARPNKEMGDWKCIAPSDPVSL